MDNKTSRTFWDLVSENPKKFLILLLSIFSLIGFLVYNGATVKSPLLSIESGKTPEPHVNGEDTVTNKPVDSNTQTLKSTKKDKARINSPKNEEQTRISRQKPQQYVSKVEDKDGQGIADVEVFCPNCLIKRVKTDKFGGFELEGYFDGQSTFWKSTITISKDKKNKIETIDWRDRSPQPIQF